MKLTLTLAILLVGFSTAMAGSRYYMRDKEGRNLRVDVRGNKITQFDRRGRIENSYRVSGNRITRFGGDGKRK